jgi:hypothetical protein
MESLDSFSDFEFTFQCKQKWHQLQPTADPDVRFCNECNLKVHAIADLLDLSNLELGKQCVAIIDPARDRIIIGGIGKSLPSQRIDRS